MVFIARMLVRMPPRMLVRHVRGKRVSTPAINLLNENPSLVALGKLTHTNPRATHEPTNPRTSPAQSSPSPTQRTNPRTYEQKQPSPGHHHSRSASLSQIPLYHIPRWFACSVYSPPQILTVLYNIYCADAARTPPESHRSIWYLLRDPPSRPFVNLQKVDKAPPAYTDLSLRFAYPRRPFAVAKRSLFPPKTLKT